MLLTASADVDQEGITLMEAFDLKRTMGKFALNGERNILLENDFGIANGTITAGINYSEVFSVSGLWAPPFVSSDFLFNIRMFGEKVKTSGYEWLPFTVKRKGTLYGVDVASSTVLIPDKRAFVVEIKLFNRRQDSVTVPVSLFIRGGMDYVLQWDFQRPAGTKSFHLFAEKSSLIKANGSRRMIIGTDIENIFWFDSVSTWNTEITLTPGSKFSCHIVVVLGEKDKTFEDYEEIIANPQKAIRLARNDFKKRVKELFEKLPVFKASDKRLTAFYYRSLVHYLTNRWQVSEFALNPFFSTGSIKGGCLLSYLWDFSEGWELHPLFDAPALKEHIKQYLKIDITSCFSFDPINGKAVGPWYPVNQEKIIGLIYYYVLNTGETGFLNETVNGRTVLNWAIYHATFWDKKNGEAELYDYGLEGEHHLELRRGYPYHGKMPDLNARRVQSYIRVFELSEVAGCPMRFLSDRAEELKKLIKLELWNPEEKWFDFIINSGKQTRLTVQMYKLIGSPVLDAEEVKGLLSHLNEEEFLSAYGLHSLSKKDPAYDPADIDNGGPGSCSVFPPQIIERLYKAGLPVVAEDVLQRILWWGTRVPYWGDSFTADHIGYRSDTPLQCTIGGVAGAQMIIFGMFGVSVMPDGNISFKPSAPSFSRDISLKGLRIMGKTFDVIVTGTEITVSDGILTQAFNAGEECVYIVENGSFVCR